MVCDKKCEFFTFLSFTSLSGPFGKGRNQTVLGVVRLVVNHPTHIHFSWCSSIKFGVVLGSYKQGFILGLKVGVSRVTATPCPAPA